MMDTDVLLRHGGPALIVLIGLSILAWGVVLERAGYWLARWMWRDRRGVLAALDLIQGRRLEAAARSLERLRRIPVARVLREGVRHAGPGVTGHLEAAALREDRAMLNHTGILDTVTAAAPLVGILGTVIGIIRSFHAFGGAGGGVPPPHQVIGGVSEALITTGAGLVVALVALVSAALARGLADRGAAELEQYVSAVESVLAKGKAHAD